MSVMSQRKILTFTNCLQSISPLRWLRLCHIYGMVFFISATRVSKTESTKNACGNCVFQCGLTFPVLIHTVFHRVQFVLFEFQSNTTYTMDRTVNLQMLTKSDRWIFLGSQEKPQWLNIFFFPFLTFFLHPSTSFHLFITFSSLLCLFLFVLISWLSTKWTETCFARMSKQVLRGLINSVMTNFCRDLFF